MWAWEGGSCGQGLSGVEQRRLAMMLLPSGGVEQACFELDKNIIRLEIILKY